MDMSHSTAVRYFVFSGMCPRSGRADSSWAAAKANGSVPAPALPAELSRADLTSLPATLSSLARHPDGPLHAHAVGFNAQYANGLAAMFIACGQDVANVANSAVGVTDSR